MAYDEQPAAEADRQPDKDGRPGQQEHGAEARKAPKGTEGAGEDDKEQQAENPDAHAKKEAGQHAGRQDNARQDKGGDKRDPMGDRVYQNFHGYVFAPGATFGASSGTTGGEAHQGRARDEGPVEESVIAGIVRAYAKPACYEQAQAELRGKHVVLLTGEPGSGRRAGAIVLLDAVRARDRPLVRINPSITTEKLAARSFDEGAGYLVSEKFAEPIAPELAEFHWDAVCHQVRKAKAHLVVTAGAGSGSAVPEAMGQVMWHKPDATDALRAHLGAAQVADDVIRKVAEALGGDYSLADIEAIARRIVAAADIDELLEELRGSDRRTVADWLDSVDAAIPAVLEVAMLAFSLGLPERVFEEEVTDLRLRLTDFAPELDTGSKEAKAEIDLRFRQLRKQRAVHKLLTIRQVPVARDSGSIAIRHVAFRVPAYRQYIIAELWNSLGGEFWSGMRRWLHEITADDRRSPQRQADLENSASVGLALLAIVAPDEVMDSYLYPWTDEDAGSSAQTMAVYIVWQMSMLDQVAPLALRIAIVWAGQGSRTQRTLAAYAFSGVLGGRYPIEATKRLGQLADQKDPVVPLAFARLFATLAPQGGDAIVVLRELRRRLSERERRSGDAVRSGDLMLEAVADLVSARDFRSGLPAVAVFLKGNPERVADIGPLWARTLYMRPWRERATSALISLVEAIALPPVGVKAKPHIEAEDLARSLGAAIGRELPQLERAPLRYEITRRVDEARRRQKRSRDARDKDPTAPRSQYFDELLEKLLNAILHPTMRELGE